MEKRHAESLRQKRSFFVRMVWFHHHHRYHHPNQRYTHHHYHHQHHCHSNFEDHQMIKGIGPKAVQPEDSEAGASAPPFIDGHIGHLPQVSKNDQTYDDQQLDSHLSGFWKKKSMQNIFWSSWVCILLVRGLVECKRKKQDGLFLSNMHFEPKVLLQLCELRRDGKSGRSGRYICAIFSSWC